jgi:hypothetical protein
MVALGEHRIEFAADQMAQRINDHIEQWLRIWLMYRSPDLAELQTSEQAGVIIKTLIYQGKPLARLSFRLREDDGAILMLPEDLTR